MEKLKASGRLGLMAHWVAGYPDIATTRDCLLMLSKNGADFIELQIPFSDPLGDGEIIREASARALSGGFRVRQAFELLGELKKRGSLSAPVLIMTYFNIVYKYGIEKFCQSAERAGASGLIIPDYNLAAEDKDGLDGCARAHNLYLIRFISLDSSQQRIRKINQEAQGFIYCFSTRGVTGGGGGVSRELLRCLERLRAEISQPLAVGFGISKREHIRVLRGRADVAVVGSALIREFNKGGLPAVSAKLSELTGFIHRLV